MLLGRLGDDFLTSGSGHDRLSGGPGTDGLVPKAGGDDVDCGSGSDTAIGVHAADFLEPGCEQVFFGRGGNAFTTDAYPAVRRAASVEFRIGCPRPEILDGLSRPIRGSLRLREPGGRHRALGAGTVARRAGRRCGDEPVPLNGVPAHVRLTGLGRRLASRHRGVRSTVHLHGHNLRTVAWTIRLRSR